MTFGAHNLVRPEPFLDYLYRVANRPGMAGIVPDLPTVSRVPGKAHFVPEM